MNIIISLKLTPHIFQTCVENLHPSICIILTTSCLPQRMSFPIWKFQRTSYTFILVPKTINNKQSKPKQSIPDKINAST